jgi:two-component system, response regulator PdtaR
MNTNDVGLKVLIVEDDALIALDLRSQLVDLGHTVCGIASNEHGALEMAATHKPDLALMDLTLAKGDRGEHVAARLHKEHGIRCIFLSVALSDDVRSNFASLEPYGFVKKPLSKRALQDALEQVSKLKGS